MERLWGIQERDSKILKKCSSKSDLIIDDFVQVLKYNIYLFFYCVINKEENKNV